MNDLPLVLIGSFLGSAHCLGMCGGFAVTIGVQSQSWYENFIRQVTYGLGRIATYSLLGLGIGIGSSWLQHQGASLLPWQAIFAGIAGVLLIVSGIRALGWRLPAISLARFSPRWNIDEQKPLLPILEQGNAACAKMNCAKNGCSPAKLFQGLLVAPQKSSLLVAGAVTGFLPCGLVYAFLTLAASRANPIEAWLTMLVFGLGTLPLMTMAGMSTQLFPVRWRKFVWQGAAVCLIVSGVLSLWRGAAAWQAIAAVEEREPGPRSSSSPTPAICPFCE